MPEALTESFCERCGTRYEFAAPTRLNTMRKTRGLISGLRNYIMSQDALSDAVGDAMRSEEEELASKQLDAFHQSFNFCIQCRQYACTNCWNESAGRCRTCVPIPGTDDLIDRFEASFHAHHPEAADEAHLAEAELNRRLGLDAWPTADLSAAEPATNGHVEAWPQEAIPQLDGVVARPEPIAAEADVVAEPEPEPVAAGADMVTEPEPEPVAAEADVVAEPEPIAAEVEVAAEADVVAEPEPVAAELALPDVAEAYVPTPAYEAAAAIAWEDDGTFELEPEPVAALPAEPDAEPVAAEADVVAEPEPEPVAAETDVVAEPEPEPVAQVPPTPIRPITETLVRLPRPAPAPEPEPVERVAAEADDASVAARKAKLDLLGIGDPGEGTLAPDRPRAMPYRSSGAAVHPVELAAHRQAQAGTAGGGFWDASAREVAGAVTQIGVQSCGECGLSLSASARFCRRCGTRQARSA